MDRERLLLSLAVTCISIALAIGHVLWPNVRIDAITVGLLVIAALPWLGPIIKSIELPSGLKVEYRERLEQVERRVAHEEERVDEIDGRVAEVERLFEFSGDAPSWVQFELNSALNLYASYLDEIGLRWVGQLPHVHVGAELGVSFGYYDSSNNRLVVEGAATFDIAKSTVDVSIALREFTHRVLYDRKVTLDDLGHGGYSRGEAAMIEIESGLASYFPCSHLNDPHLGAIAGSGSNTGPIEDLTEQHDFRTLAGGPSMSRRYEAGQAWSSLFWELRSELGRDALDRILVDAWVTATLDDDFDSKFVAGLYATDYRDTIRRIALDRGLGAGQSP